MRKLPSFDMTDEKNIKKAKSADESGSGASGKYIATIQTATLRTAENGSTFIDMSFLMPNGKVWKQPSKQICKSEKDKFADGFFVPKLATIFGITGAKDTEGTVTIMDGEFIDGAYVEKEVEVPAYVDLIGKKIGVVVNFYQQYPNSLGINGYTNRPIPSRELDEAGYKAAKDQATTIWMPNYQKKEEPVFDFALFFDPETEKTYSEMLDDNLEKPVRVAEELEKIMKKSHKASVLEGEEWDKLRIKKLKANLKKAGLQYIKDDFEPSASSGINDHDDTDDDDVA